MSFQLKSVSFGPQGVPKIERQLEIIELNSIRSRTPGVLWHQEWEVQADQLNESLKKESVK